MSRPSPFSVDSAADRPATIALRSITPSHESVVSESSHRPAWSPCAEGETENMHDVHVRKKTENKQGKGPKRGMLKCDEVEDSDSSSSRRVDCGSANAPSSQTVFSINRQAPSFTASDNPARLHSLGLVHIDFDRLISRSCCRSLHDKDLS